MEKESSNCAYKIESGDDGMNIDYQIACKGLFDPKNTLPFCPYCDRKIISETEFAFYHIDVPTVCNKKPNTNIYGELYQVSRFDCVEGYAITFADHIPLDILLDLIILHVHPDYYIKVQKQDKGRASTILGREKEYQ